MGIPYLKVVDHDDLGQERFVDESQEQVISVTKEGKETAAHASIIFTSPNFGGRGCRP
jgi:hypothetical protein